MKFNLTPILNYGSIPEKNPEAETGFVKSSAKFVLENTNGMAHDALMKLKRYLTEEEFSRLSIDTRTHLLFRDHYPCIPGWHCDFVSRNEAGIIEPNPELDAKVRHFLVVVGEPCPEFVAGHEIELPIETPHWREVSQAVEAAELPRFAVESGTIYEFDATALHRGMPATKTGWRWFFRATLFPEGDKRNGDFLNKFRKHTQVYLVNEHTGW